MSRAISASRPLQLELREEALAPRSTGKRGQLGDRAAREAHGERFAVEPLALARRADLVSPSQPFDPPRSSPVCSSSKPSQLQAGAVARRAPAVLRVEREQARVELGEAAAARRARALGREDRRSSRRARRSVPPPASREPARATCTTPLPSSSARASASRNARSFAGVDRTSATGSSIVCSLKRSSRGQRAVGRNVAVDAQVREALAARPISRDRCNSPCARRPAARAARCAGRDSRAELRRRCCPRSAARSARRIAGSTACRASRRAAAGSDRSRSASRPCSCGRRGSCAARSRPSAECRRSRRRPGAPPAARTGARRRSAIRDSGAGLRRTGCRRRACSCRCPRRR